MPWLSTRDLRRHYRRGRHVVTALDGLSLDIEQGDCLAVVGASGSGKSTLLNLLAGLDTPTGGHVTFDGARLDRMTGRELAAYRAREVGIVFQSFHLLPQHTARRNVELALYFQDHDPAERRRLAVEALDRVGLADRAGHAPDDLSGGERQRVAIARALVKRPRLVLADEPTGNLDRDNAETVANLLADLNRDGLTVVLVTHDETLAARLAPRIVRLRYGRPVDDGEAPA